MVAIQDKYVFSKIDNVENTGFNSDDLDISKVLYKDNEIRRKELLKRLTSEYFEMTSDYLLGEAYYNYCLDGNGLFKGEIVRKLVDVDVDKHIGNAVSFVCKFDSFDTSLEIIINDVDNIGYCLDYVADKIVEVSYSIHNEDDRIYEHRNDLIISGEEDAKVFEDEFRIAYATILKFARNMFGVINGFNTNKICIVYDEDTDTYVDIKCCNICE